MRFDGQVVWVTGASSGIGEELARVLVEQGARVVLSARREERLREVAADCGGPAHARVLPLDVADHERLPGLAAQAWSLFGQVDVLVNNAGLSQRELAESTDWTVDKRLVDVDYLGPVVLTKALLPRWLERGRGHVVVVSSVAGRMGVPMRSGYSGAKFALKGFFDALRVEVGDRGIGVTMVYPGFVHTDISRNAVTGDGRPHAVLDDATAAGLPARACAEHIADAIHECDDEAIIAGPRERLAIWLARFAPRLLTRVLRKARVT